MSTDTTRPVERASSGQRSGGLFLCVGVAAVTRLVASGGDARVLVGALAAVLVLGRPWSRGRAGHATGSIPAVLLLAGLFADASLLIALGGVGFAAAGLDRLGVRPAHPSPAALAAVAVVGLPWCGSDFDALAELFRWTGAVAAATLARVGGVPAVASGARIDAPGVTILVDATCSGMATLQACALAAALVHALPGKARGVTQQVATVVGVAWSANVLRLTLLLAIALAFGADAARGPAHQAAGLAAMVLPALILVPARTRRTAATELA